MCMCVGGEGGGGGERGELRGIGEWESVSSRLTAYRLWNSALDRLSHSSRIFCDIPHETYSMTS